MDKHVGVLTRNPFKHPGGKVAYCSMSRLDEDFELVVFRTQRRAYEALLSLVEGDIVEVRGTVQLDTYKNTTTKQIIVYKIAKDSIDDKEFVDEEELVVPDVF